MMVFLAKSPLVDKYNLSSVQLIHCASSPLRSDLIEMVQRRLGIDRIRQGYGLTETMTVLKQNSLHNKVGSVGVLRPGIWAKVCDPINKIAVGPNCIGELAFKGETVMRGYLCGKESSKAKLFDQNGWMFTGDLGYYDETGEWYIVDQIQDIITFNGNQVAPSDLEAQLLKHPLLKEVAVIGIPDDVYGEVAKAFVVAVSEEMENEKNTSILLDFIKGIYFRFLFFFYRNNYYFCVRTITI